MKLRTTLLITLLIALLSIAIVGCSSNESEPESDIDPNKVTDIIWH